MRSIDNRVRDLAIRELERDGGASLAINISGLTATERSWFRGLVARLKERRDIATRLIVEITETAALQDIDETSRFVSALRALGCKVPLDDFGDRKRVVQGTSLSISVELGVRSIFKKKK